MQAACLSRLFCGHHLQQQGKLKARIGHPSSEGDRRAVFRSAFCAPSLTWLQRQKRAKWLHAFQPPLPIPHFLDSFALDHLYNCATMYIHIREPVACCRALGDITRLRIMRLLVASGDEACLCELEKSLQEPGYKLSRHLKILRDAGLLEAEKEGRWVYHRVATSPDFVGHLRDFVMALPDAEGIYGADLARFEAGQACRVGGRCRGERKDTSVQEELVSDPAVADGRG